MPIVLRLRNPDLHVSRLTGHAEVSAERQVLACLCGTDNMQPWLLPPSSPSLHFTKAHIFSYRLQIILAFSFTCYPWHNCTMWVAWDALPLARGESVDPWGDFPGAPLSQMGATLHWPFLGRCQISPQSSPFSQPYPWSTRTQDCM